MIGSAQAELVDLVHQEVDAVEQLGELPDLIAVVIVVGIEATETASCACCMRLGVGRTAWPGYRRRDYWSRYRSR